jgi:LmbE family N-acetylglucosaminyl deacetylase
VSGLPPWLDLLSDYPSLVGQSLIIVALVNFKAVGEGGAVQRRILAVGAYPDDIEIACGGTLAKMRDAGYQVRGLVMTQGERSGNGHVRPCEAQRAAEFLGLDQVQVLDFPDTRLHEQTLDILAAIERAIQEFKPNIIFMHSSHDLHQDHRAVHEATLRAARNLSMILCYESPSVTQEFVPTFFSDIGDYLDVKVEGIKEHRDQRSKPYVQEERVRGTAVFRGGQVKLHYAEGFEVVRAVSTMMGEA